MTDIATSILQAAGVSIPPSQDDAMSLLEAWLDLPEKRMEFDGPTEEDCTPFDVTFYRTLGSALVQVWSQPTTSSVPVTLFANAMIGQRVSLYESSIAVRVTRWLRHWMDLNVMGNQDSGVESTKTLSNFLLESCETKLAENIPIVKAIYDHILALPFLNSQINSYTRNLMKTIGSSSGLSAQPPSRNEQYQRIQEVTNHLQKEWEAHLERLQWIITDWYTVGSPDIRRLCRHHLGNVWSHFLSSSGGGGLRVENTSASGIRMTLVLLYRILLGVTTLRKSHEHLLFQQLIPLHQPNAMVLWRDQTSVLDLYHEPLVQCIAVLLQKKPEWIPPVVAALFEPEIWTINNTPKLVLLLHEIDTLIGLLPSNDDGSLSVTLGNAFMHCLTTLGRCISSDHSQLSERALQFFKNDKFKSLVASNYELSLMTLLPSLVRAEPPWNPSVRKITYFVLNSLKDQNDSIFARVCDKLFSFNAPEEKIWERIEPKQHAVTMEESPDDTPLGAPQATADFSLKAGMGDWRPPTVRSSRPKQPTASSLPPSRRGTPPSTVTGVAPWTSPKTPSAGSGAPPLTITGVAPWAKNPPSTITGVAPWAQRPPSQKRPAPETHPDKGVPTVLESPDEELPVVQNSGVAIVIRYMEIIKPPDQVEGASPWAREQMAESPTLLPKLKFHDLVFGHELGSGFFGSVRYARLIDQSKTRSHWAEYAVKVVSTEKIKEMGYEFAIQREIAVLHILAHPGIARLVSSFRFRDGAYLVLEYASRGDLHTLLRQKGSLDHESTSFVIGEVVAALASIHDLGLVYGDLKPENILITETGHIKLTDFGACRPVTEEAARLIKFSAQKILSNLRDGDWKTQTQRVGVNEDLNNEEETAEEVEDERVEGTTAYLPPEVVMGARPNTPADAWALGCVMYQCLSGRPPILELDDSMTRDRIVSFNEKSSNLSHDHELFHGNHASKIRQESRQLILKLLDRYPTQRPSMDQVADDEFFKKEGIDVFSLHRQTAHPLDAGGVAPVADAQWSRRQLSSIWAPQPRAYDVAIVSSGNSGTALGLSSRSEPIVEGEEAFAFFSKSRQARSLENISEN